jgi:hypothetical protein
MQADSALAERSTEACQPSILDGLGRHRWLLGGLAVALIAAGFAWQWSWLVAIGVAPLLIGVAPCVAMCALGLCMHRMGNRTDNPGQDIPTTRLISDGPSS